MNHRAIPASLSRLSRAVAALGTGLAVVMTVLPAPVLAQSSKTAAATTLPSSAVLEIRQRLQAIGMHPVNVDAFVARLAQLSLTDVRSLATDLQSTRLQQLLGSDIAPATGLPSGNQVQGTFNPASGGSALQSSVTSAINPGIGGLAGQRTGQAADSCQACDATGTMGSSSGTNTNDPTKTVTTQSGTVIKIYSDGSASITPAGGKTEYINSGHQIVDNHGAAKEPSPDAETRSGVVTAKDIATALARLNANRTTNPDAATGSGGSVDANRSNPVGSRGLFTDVATRAQVSISAVREVIRVAVERLRGPSIGG